MCFLLGLLFSNTLICGQIRLFCLSRRWSTLNCNLWSAEAFGNTDPLGQGWMEVGARLNLTRLLCLEAVGMQGKPPPAQLQHSLEENPTY